MHLPSGNAHGVALSDRRTIDRVLAHRAAVSEVFLTDLQVVDTHDVRIAAQLPRCHGYFHDHVTPGPVDPMLLLEVCRQATLVSAHALDVAGDTILISSDFALDILDPAAFDDLGPPVVIQIDSHFDWTASRNGKARAGQCRQTLRVRGASATAPAATHVIAGKLMTRTQLAALRSEQRGDTPPGTQDMPPRGDAVALPPARVARYNPVNSVLSRLKVEGRVLSATIAPPWQNRALFDHSYDHLTMQLLTEAARQLAQVAFAPDAGTWRIRGISGRFAGFAEIDLPVIVRLEWPSAPGPVFDLRVGVSQVGEEIAHLILTCARPDAGTV